MVVGSAVGNSIMNSIRFFRKHTELLSLIENGTKIKGFPQIKLVAMYSSKASKPDDVPKNPLSALHSASDQAENGLIFDKKPFKMRCEKGKKYSWCLCGRSKNQPLCDGTHKSPYLKITQRPIRFEVTEDKEYWLCNCKQTSNRPFCDGTHKREDVQAAIK